METVMSYWIGYTSDTCRRAAFYFSDVDARVVKVAGTDRKGWFAVSRVRWWARRNRRWLRAGIPVGVRHMPEL